MKTRNCRIKVFPVLIPALIFLFLIPFPFLGSETAVQGVVTDEEGQPLKDARLTFEDPSRGLSFHLKTDKNGRFIKVGIPPAVYKVTVELEGYFLLESEARIRLGLTENLRIALEKPPPQLNEDEDLDEGASFFKDGQYDKAVESFKKVVEKFPGHYEGYYNLGLAYLKKEDFGRAVPALEKAVEVNPHAVPAYFALGEGYFALGKSDEATQSFSKAIALDPENSRAFYNLGIILYRLDKTEEALETFKKAVELDPAFSSAYYQAALSAVKLGDFEKAVRYFEDFLKAEPDASEAAQVKAMIEELKKRLK